MKKYTICVEFKDNGYVAEGNSFDTAEEAWTIIDETIECCPALADSFAFSVVETETP